MAERLAKRKTEQDAELQRQRSAALRAGIANPPTQQDSGGGTGLWPSWKELGNAGKIAGKGVLGMVNTIAATPIDTADFAVQQLEKAVGVKPTDKFDPASVGSFNLLGETYRAIDRAANYTAGNIAAIPGAGKPSSSPFMDTVRASGWANALAEPIVNAVNVASVAYPLSKFAVNTRIPQIAGSAYQDMVQARIARQNAPAYRYTGDFIDMVEGPNGVLRAARTVDTPATPATRLAEAQTQRALPPAQVAPIEVAPSTSRLTPPPFRERPVPSTNRLTLETDVTKTGGGIIIRSFNQTTGEYNGVITINYDPFYSKQSVITGLSATNPMVTPQLIAAAASEIRKLVGDVKYPLTPATSLSRFSRPFVERLQQAGLIDPAYKLPEIDNINDIQKTATPETFADENPYTTSTVIDPLSYTPGYNEVLKALVESKRQAKLAGEYGKLTTPSSELTPQRVTERLERELEQRTTAHLETLTKPIETLQSTDFPMLSQKYLNDGGVPDITSEIKQGMSFPVYKIYGRKIAFGNPDLGRFSPEFVNTDVEFIPVNPYIITQLDKTSLEGQKYAQLMFDAHQGVLAETSSSKNIGQVSALTYAASHGDNIALKELERLASVGQKSLTAERLKETERILSFHKDWSDPKYWNQKSSVQVQTGIAPDGYTRTQRPMGIDDMFLVHQTDYAPTYDVNGNIVLKPTGDYTPIDPATGKPMIDKITGKPVSMPDRDNVHFTINHLVTGHMWRQSPTSESNVIIVPLRDVLDANPGSLDNLYAIDTFLTPKPGQGLVIPMQKGKVLYQGQSAAGEFENDIAFALSEIGKRHNNSPEYQTKIITGGPHYAGTQYVDERITQLGLEDIPNEYPEYVGGVLGTTHQNHPSYFVQGFDNFDVQGGTSYLTGFNYWRLSPNQKLRIYDSNTSKYTTGSLDTTYQPDYGL